MRLALTLFALVTTVCGAAGADLQKSDADLSVALLGSWEALATSGPHKIESESTYTKDGFVAGFFWATATYPNGTTEEVTVKVRASWKVADGFLLVNDYTTDPPGVLPAAYSQKYKILSLTADEVIFRALDDGSELHRRRKRANQLQGPTQAGVTPSAYAPAAPPPSPLSSSRSPQAGLTGFSGDAGFAGSSVGVVSIGRFR